MLPATIVANSYMPMRVRKELDWALPIRRGARKLAAQRVQEWLSFHGFSVAIDADFGPATEQRVKDFQGKNGLAATGVVDAPTHEKLVAPLVKAIAPLNPGGNTMAELLLRYARQHIAVHPIELGGPNAGPWVRAYLGWDGVEAKWCSGFACFALEQACATLHINQPIPSSSGCDAMAAGAKNAGLFHRGAATTPAQIKSGSFFLLRKTSSDWVHIGIVADAQPDLMRTLEGNTDGNGSSNGFEATERVRNYASKDFIIWL